LRQHRAAVGRIDGRLRKRQQFGPVPQGFREQFGIAENDGE
jgi:hypothetical protein